MPLLILQHVGQQSLEAQLMLEKVTRPTIGVKCCPVAGIPESAEEQEEDLAELTHEMDLQ